MTSDKTILHATTVCVADKGVLIIGPSGSGKSSLGMELMVRGGQLVADDRTEVWLEGGRVLAAVPEAIEGLIEARQVGLIRTAPRGPVAIDLVVDMGRAETERLPQAHVSQVLGLDLPCLHKADTPHFPSAVYLYIKGNL